MKLLRIATNEFRYLFWSFQTLLAFTALLGFAAMFTADGESFQLTIRGGNILINAPTMITFFLLMSGVVSIFFIPSYMGTAVLKDFDNKFDAILFSMPISKNDYIFGRFLGAFTTLMVVMAAGPVGMYLGTFWPWATPETLAPNNISHYLTAYFGFLLPTMLVVSSLVFAVAIISRNMMFCYVAVLGLFILYIIGQGSNTISPLWDPFMLRTFDDQIAYWTAAEINNNFIRYTGTVLANRLIWLGVAVVLFFTAYKQFSFRVPKKMKPAKIEESGYGATSFEQSPHPETGYQCMPDWSKGTHFKQFLFCTKFEVLAVLKSNPFILLMGFSLFLLVGSLIDRDVYYQVNALPVTRILTADITEALIWAMFAITAFYGADVVWRDRENKCNEFLDATATPNWVFVVSKIVALIAVIYSILLLGVGVAILIQILNGYYLFEFGLYFERIFLYSTTFIYLAVLSCFFQVLVKSRFLGIMLMFLFGIGTLGAMGIFGFEHPLLRYALGTVQTPLSDMNGSGRFMVDSLWIRGYYTAIAGFLVMLTYVLWNRGTLQPLKYRLKNLRAFKTRPYLVSLACLFALFIGSGSYVFYNTNILNEYRTRPQAFDMQMTYEKLFRKYETLPMPRVVDVKLNIDIFPYKQRVEIKGLYVLSNKTDEDISTVHIVFPPRFYSVNSVTLEGASLKSVNEDFHYYIYSLKTPMVPGERRSLEFRSLMQNKGFTHRNPNLMLIRNGTYFDNRRIAPHIGFNSKYMVENRNKRREAGLEPLPRIAKLEDVSQYKTNGISLDSDYVVFEATLSTVSDQIAVSPGYLTKEWLEGDRRYFTYKMDKPIVNVFNIMSAEYETVKDKWNDVDLEIFHHKTHTYNLDRMMESTKDSLAYFTKEFSPYQFKQLRILEFPAYRNFARSFPNTISYSEDLGFLADISDSTVIDVPYYVTAHEVAHQWWAHQITPANVQGAALITETLSQYSALMVMEKKYGKDQIRKFLKIELDSYLSERDDDAEGEVSLLRVENQPYLHYRKGSVIMYALKDYLGEDVVNRALKRFIQNHAFKTAPYPTSTMLLNYIKEEAGPKYLGLIEDFFEKITLYDVKITDNQVQEMADGRFKVIIGLDVAKYYSDAIGNQTQVPFDIPLDIGLFLENPDKRGFGSKDVILLEKRIITDGISTIEIIVDQKPTVVGIDPYNKLIDRNSDDNLQAVEDSTG